jgi:hypothetical protein
VSGRDSDRWYDVGFLKLLARARQCVTSQRLIDK